MERIGRLETIIVETLVPKLTDHETRLRFVERYMSMGLGALGLISFLFTVWEHVKPK